MKNAGIPIIGNGPSSTGGWTPQAIVTCYDDATNERIPLQGVKVRVSTLLNVGIGYTDKDGMVNIPKGRGGKFKNPVRYQIVFDNDYWKIKNAIKQVATIQSPKTNQSWLYYISPENKELSAYGAVHRSLYYFYFKQNILTKPTYVLKRLKIKTLWDQSHPEYAGLFSSPRTITVCGKSPKGSDNYYPRYQIMRTMFHELGHASHYKYRGRDYNSDGYVSQSYADAVAYYCLSQLYPDRNVLNNIKKEYAPEHPEYTQIGESLFNQGLTMAQLQSSVKSAVKWEDWRQAVKSVSSVPDWLVDFLFANREYTFDFSLVNSSTYHENGNDLCYLNISTGFYLQHALVKSGAIVKSWWSSCPEYKVVEQTPEYAKFAFSKTGNYLIYANVELPNGTTFRAQKSVTVKNLPSIIGPKAPRVGIAYSYEVDDYNDLNAFMIGNYDEAGNFGIANASSYLEFYNPALSNALNIVVFNPGNYIIRAAYFKENKYVSVDYPISVRAESTITDGNRYGPGIYTVSAYQHKTNKNIKHIFWDRKTIFYPTTYSNLGEEHKFKAYTLDIPSDHPYYSKLRYIYKHDYNGLEAYSQGLLFATDNRTLIENGGTPVFKVLKEQVPGSVPLYSMDLKTEQNGKVISQCRYMGLVNLPDGYTQEGNYTYYLTNMGLLGYVFPLQ